MMAGGGQQLLAHAGPAPWTFVADDHHVARLDLACRRSPLSILLLLEAAPVRCAAASPVPRRLF